MARMTYTIELKVEFDDQTRHKAVQKILRDAARRILTSSMLLADKERVKPQVAFYSDNFFEGTTTLSIQELTSDDASD